MTKTQIEKTRGLVAFTLVVSTALFGVTAFCWSHLATPEIKKMIVEEQSPVVNALEFQNFLMMETLSDSVVARAERRYIASRRGSAR